VSQDSALTLSLQPRRYGLAFVLCCLVMPALAEEPSDSPINLDAARQQFLAAQEIRLQMCLW